MVGSEVAIHELRDDLSDSDESSGTEANDYMYAAGMQVARAHNERDNMVLALNNMVSTSSNHYWKAPVRADKRPNRSCCL